MYRIPEKRSNPVAKPADEPEPKAKAKAETKTDEKREPETADAKLDAKEVRAAIDQVLAEVDKRIAAAIDKYAKQDKTEDRDMMLKMIREVLGGDKIVTKSGTVETPSGTQKVSMTEVHRRG